ncbi:PhoP regulatory network protein YrbL [Opitutaceae bacterium TAV1]|nr:PhoP regulatory network protein YrbL [Opitutaceae bacterium TAV1]
MCSSSPGIPSSQSPSNGGVLELPPPFAYGGNRTCHVHPSDPALCVKVASPGRTPELKRARANFFKRLRPLRTFDENWEECRQLVAIRRKVSSQEQHRFPAWHGRVVTNLGPGGVTTLYRNADGHISHTLEWHIWEEGLSEQIIRIVDEFTCFWRKETPPSRALLLHNILLVRPAERPAFLAVIDGLGYPGLFQPELLVKQLAKRKAARQVQAFRQRIDMLLRYRSGQTGNEEDFRFLRGRLKRSGASFPGAASLSPLDPDR